MADEWLAYQLDLATLMRARQVEELMGDGKMKAAAALTELERRDKVTRGQGDKVTTGTGFRPLARPGIPRVRIPENGIW